MANDVTENTDGDQLHVKHKSLLAKYEIPIDHLSYEHIRGCNSVKELERIVKILRSGEEGYFPDLQKTAEERLGHLSPDNRHLRTEVPALDRSCFNQQEWKDILGDIEHWKKEVSVRDKQLCSGDDCDASQTNLPPVRQPLLVNKTSGSSDNASKPKSKKKVSDYAFWDKYDVETELLKMDLEEERNKGNAEKKTLTNQTETDRLKLVVEEAQNCSETEKQILAEQEKIRGNEYFQAKDYVEAEKYYTASLAIHPTAKAYNNRASCYLKQNKYSETIQDADSTLKLEPNNIKALYRKGIALKHMNEYQHALENMNSILRQAPNQSQAQQMAKQLTEQINAEMKIPDYDLKKLNRKDNKNLPCCKNQTYTESKRCFELNEWGLPKALCRCSGTLKCNVAEHKSDPQPSFPPVPSPALKKKPGNVRIIELSDESEQPKQKHPTKLEIVEIDSPHHEPLKDFCRPTKCNVVDKRTQKASSEHGGGDMI